MKLNSNISLLSWFHPESKWELIKQREIKPITNFPVEAFLNSTIHDLPNCTHLKTTFHSYTIPFLFLALVNSLALSTSAEAFFCSTFSFFSSISSVCMIQMNNKSTNKLGSRKKSLVKKLLQYPWQLTCYSKSFHNSSSIATVFSHKN